MSRFAPTANCMKLAAVLALAFALRAWNLHGHGFTADEVNELHLAHAPMASIVTDDDDDRFPPLYRTLVGLWIRTADSDLASRWFSVVCGVLGVAAVYAAGKELLGRRDAWLPALLLACSPYHIAFCREGRAYPLFILFSAGMFYGALRILRCGDVRGWMAWTASAVAAVWTHYYAVPLVGTLWLIVAAASARRKIYRGPLIAAGALTLLLLPAAYLLYDAFGSYSKGKLVAWFDVEAFGYMLVNQALGFSVGPSMVELRSIPAVEGVRQFAPWIAVLAVVWSVLGVSALIRLRATWRLALLLTPLFALVPLLGLLGNTLGLGFVDRYASWMCIPYALLLGAGAARCRRQRVVRAALAALLATNLLAVYQSQTNDRYAPEDYRAVAARIEQLADPSDAVLVASSHVEQALRYYLGDARPMVGFPIFAERADEREAALEKFLATRPSGQRFWLVSQWLPADDIRREVRDAAGRRFRATLRAELNQALIYEATTP